MFSCLINCLLFIISSAVSWFCINYYKINPEQTITALVAYTSIAATMLGFMLTLLAIIISISHTRLLRNMAKTGHYRILTNQIYLTFCLYIIALSISLFGLFTTEKILLATVSLSTGVVFTAAINTWCIVVRFRQVLNALLPNEGERLE